MEAIKPLIVLGLFGTILYGAYTVVQKGPSPEAAQTAATDAPAFAPPAVEVQQQPAMPALAATPVAAPPSAQPDPVPPPPALPTAPPPAIVDALPPAASPEVGPSPPAAVIAAAPIAPPPAPPAIDTATLPVPPPAQPAPPSPASGGFTEAAVATAAVAGLAAGAAAATAAAPAPPVAAPPGTPTYLAAESAPPPAQEDVAAGHGGDRPERLAALAPPPAASLPPEMPPPPGTLPSSAAFATAWTDAHEKLSAGRYAEALTALSVWYDDPSLGLEESHRLEDLLGQLAGTVIYSQQDLLLPPHVVAPGETLPAIAAQFGVSWQLLAKINGISDPMQLVPGEHLKVIRGPFDAVLSVARRRISLQVSGAYAGSFPVSVGREFLPRVGSAVPVAEIRRDPAAAAQPDASPAILLADGLSIQAADDPAVVTEDAAPASLVVSVRDLAELLDILGPGSRVLIRQ